MLISVIVPYYNVGKKVCRCLASLQQQEFPDFEALLVDDGSVDDSYEIVHATVAGDKRFHLFRQEHQGVSSARNLAMSQAVGEYFCFVDADDEVASSYLSDLYTEALASQADLVIQSIAHVFTGQVDLISPGCEGVFDLNTGFQSFFQSIHISSSGSVCAKLFRKAIILQNDLIFHEDVSMCEDQCFLIEYLQHVRYVVLSKTSNYRYLATAYSGSDTYHDYFYESKAYLQIRNAWHKLLQTYPCMALQAGYGVFVGNYVDRLVFSALTHPSCKEKRHLALRDLEVQFLPEFRELYHPSTLYTRVLKTCILSQKYWWYRLFKKMAIRQYSIGIRYC